MADPFGLTNNQKHEWSTFLEKIGLSDIFVGAQNSESALSSALPRVNEILSEE